jgi:kinesin family protein 16B
MQGKTTELKNPKNDLDVRSFNYDFSYDTQTPGGKVCATQEQIFSDLGEDVIQSAFDGYNACIFAYGQTGSGKSYSMMGSDDDIGLIPRICTALFDKPGEADTKYSAEVSYLEIYNEKVKDLLNVPTPSGEKGVGGKKAGKRSGSPRRKAGSTASLRVRENPATGPFVEGLSVHTVSSGADINGLMEIGNAARTTAATLMNDTSSRSHAVFTIRFTQASFVAGIPAEKTSKLNLVDLAGSERTSSTGATGQQLKEGGSINKSLTTLGIVINELAKAAGPKAQKFIPYRDSVLTWLLRESLGGNSKTIMLAAISPAAVNFGETLSTLHYANRAKNIVNKPIVNEDENVRIIKELRKEVDELKAMLGEKSASAELDAKIKQSEQLAAELTSNWSERWNDTQKVLEDKQLHLAEHGLSVSLDSDRPHLVNLNLHDSLASGVTLHYLKDPDTTLGKADPTEPVDIELQGSDAELKHCVITIQSPSTVSLMPLNGLCGVNGEPIEKAIQLVQGMQLTLGQDNVFRFNHPIQAKEMRGKRARGEFVADEQPRSKSVPPRTARVSPTNQKQDEGVASLSASGPINSPGVFSDDTETLQFRLLELQAQQQAQEVSAASMRGVCLRRVHIACRTTSLQHIAGSASRVYLYICLLFPGLCPPLPPRIVTYFAPSTGTSYILHALGIYQEFSQVPLPSFACYLIACYAFQCF